MTINDLIDKLVGKPFEIECSDIQVHGMLGHQPPICRGPGVIKSQAAEGKIIFRMHNQIEASPEALSSLQWFRSDGKGLEPASLVTISAEDYDGMSWGGGWSLPKTHRSIGSSSIVSGDLNQLSARMQKSAADKIDVTELVYGQTLHLPLTKSTDSVQLQDGRILKTRTSRDRHDLDFKGAKISITQSDENNRTHITAKARQGFRPPHVEIWVADALNFVNASLVYPRMVIRHFEKDALIFLRAYPVDNRSGMPSPAGGWESEYWDLFTLYLAKS